jgi:hypothetical protein
LGADETGVLVLELDFAPKDDLRELVSGMPKRLCRRIRVEVGCLEAAAEREDDVEGGSGGVGEGRWKGGGEEEENALILASVVGRVSRSKSTLELVDAGLTLLPAPPPLDPVPPCFFPFPRVCVGVTKLVIVECVPVVIVLSGRLWLLVTGFELALLGPVLMLRVGGVRFP